MRRSWIMAPMLLALFCGCMASPPATPSPTPAEEEHHDHDHPEGIVELSGLQVKSARLKVEEVGLRSFSGDFQATGTLTYDKDLQVRVTSPLPGKAIELRSRLGEVVSRGQVLAIIDCPELVKYKADYHEAETDYRLAQQSLERRRALAHYGDITRRPLDDAPGTPVPIGCHGPRLPVLSTRRPQNQSCTPAESPSSDVLLVGQA